MIRAWAFSLVEVLVALTLAALLAGLLGATVRTTLRVGERVDHDVASTQTRTLAAALVRGEIERAGRGGPSAEGRFALRLDATGGGADVIEVGYLAEADRAEPTLLRASFFAARDARGRANLYRRPPGGVRQPWLLGVDGVHVVSGRDGAGRYVARSELVPGTTLVALEIELRFDEGPPTRFWASTRRAGRLDAPVGPEGTP